MRLTLLMAAFGLAVNVVLWSVPIVVASSGLPGAVLPGSMPSLAEALASTEQHAQAAPSVPDALLQLVGAEAEAMHVAGAAIQAPEQPGLAPRAEHAGERVRAAVSTYVGAVVAVFQHR